VSFRSKRVVLVAAALAFQPWTLSAPAQPFQPFRLVAGSAPKKQAKDAPAPPSTPQAMTSLKGVTVTLEYADAERRAAFLKTIDPQLKDPFAVPPGSAERAIVFVVGFDNQSRADVQFQPGNVVLMSNHGDRTFPIDMTDLYLGAEHAEHPGDLQSVIDRTTRILFDSATTIPQGAHRARLLAFKQLEGTKWKELQIHFAFLQIEGETHTISFIFHKEPLAP
jgi:hypothetical protein